MDATALLESTGVLLPHITVLVTGLVILVLDLFLTPRSRYLNEVVGIVGVLMALLLTVVQSGAPRAAFLNMAVADGVGAFFNVTFLLIAGLTMLLSVSYVRREDIQAGEYYALVLFATAGFMFVAAAADLVMIFLAIETLSIATYILAGLQRQEPRSQEAAFKYFILGAFSSAFFLYGIATIYGAHGHTNLLALGRAVGRNRRVPSDVPGHGAADGGTGLQSGRGALSHVGSGCVRGCPHGGDSVHDRWSQGRSLCGLRARVFAWLWQPRRWCRNGCQSLRSWRH